ncbi:MAG: 50S ribosomal protein L3 [Chloroflexi bacterium]|nr:50S ribosomal protein L3 [Chloroflexota bacterium]MCL5074971.1 50S ribosomal protein L3 [Chloroflexota bacterium]
MVEGILGRKVGMTRISDPTGIVMPVTVIEAGPCYVTQIKTVAKDGYEAVQLGFAAAKRLNKPERGHLKKLLVLRHLREIKAKDIEPLQIGQKIDVGIFKAGELVDITGISKGKGFAGVVKRHHFAGGPKTHGQSDRHRAPGSIGATTTPGRVLKGTRMAGRMGHRRVTVQNLQVVQADPERNLLLVKGAVPGARNSLLLVKRARKMRVAAGPQK